MPKQNVDHAFHSAAFLTQECEVVIGLVQQRDEDRITLVETKGDKRTIFVEPIESEKSSGTSLMPENLGEVLSVQELSDLIAYLRRRREAQ